MELGSHTVNIKNVVATLIVVKTLLLLERHYGFTALKVVNNIFKFFGLSLGSASLGHYGFMALKVDDDIFKFFGLSLGCASLQHYGFTALKVLNDILKFFGLSPGSASLRHFKRS